MRELASDSDEGPIRLCFGRRLKQEFHGIRIITDIGLLAYHELDEVLGLTASPGDLLANTRTDKNGWRAIVGPSH